MKDFKVCLEDWTGGDGETIQRGQRFRYNMPFDYYHFILSEDVLVLRTLTLTVYSCHFVNFLNICSYTVVTVLFQYILPLVLINVIYCKIYNFLKVKKIDFGLE